MKKNCVIAIDGPAGSGKSSVARLVAKKLGFLYVDTGAMYRALAWKAYSKKIVLNDLKKLIPMALKTQIDLNYDDAGKLQVFVDKKNVSKNIRTEIISQWAKAIAQIPQIRKILVDRQRELGRNKNVVMEGRDIGTVVFPKAKFKFYLDATPQERAKRRFKELKLKGEKVSLNSLAQALQERDQSDSLRRASPLKIAKGALVLDSTSLELEEVVQRILDRIGSKDL
ncbi:MAG: cytidylate kinase [Elusimicrobia bacterium RIFCSPLOWO2_02_FULL_39_32]|nr:MAG: cytidylate kinase [Elusimicrobia bacterium GWA2_38_7]OGR81117.1 MAG: cytidylate kinase [Elusimicrobia bacterium RIFCSPHIGHO2_02_FULL_39_36]OGR91005.1 MAG: cytidylate kinase [Elusimicrobia bacterium RIFCSPLOWO2_02_FULL_39_32]OGR98313.1 MAG: cytidylate kinase [Elusimicrobia bacterium RIFCSPLOWO2_12_FULL_39_28]